jgi:alpha/beta superfamily hydrolase
LKPALREFHLTGAAGRIQAAAHEPPGAPRGICVVCHPHPLFGGTMDNKVAVTLARAFCEIGFVAVRFNFRGVGTSDGEHDHGAGETDDAVAIVDYARITFGELPLALAGFSFGGAVATRVAKRVQPDHMVLVAPAIARFGGIDAPAGTLVIQGEQDDVVPLSEVLDWARPLDLPVMVIPGADHFFHRRLHHVRDLIVHRHAERIGG